MGKMYTIDGKLLTERPELRIGEKIYAIDDRKKTMDKIISLSKDKKSDESIDVMGDTIKIALGDAALKEIDKLELSFIAYKSVYENILSAITGEDVTSISEDRFQGSTE